MKKLLLTAVLLSASLATSSVAVAQSKDDVKKAQEHFQKGAEWFAKGDYPKAVVEFISGHALAPNAMFLYNVSLSYERMGKIDDALSAAEGAKQYEGMPDEVAMRNDARIRAFEVMKGAERTADKMKQIAEKGDGDGDGVGDGDGDGDVEMVERPDGIKALGWAGIGLTAVGGGLAVAGLLTNSAIMNDIEDYRTAANEGDRARYDELAGDIEAKQSRGQLFYAVGAGAAGVGLTLFLIDLFTGTETVPASAWISPAADRTTVGVTLRFR